MFVYEHKNISTIVKKTKCDNWKIDFITPALDPESGDVALVAAVPVDPGTFVDFVGAPVDPVTFVGFVGVTVAAVWLDVVTEAVGAGVVGAAVVGAAVVGAAVVGAAVVGAGVVETDAVGSAHLGSAVHETLSIPSPCSSHIVYGDVVLHAVVHWFKSHVASGTQILPMSHNVQLPSGSLIQPQPLQLQPQPFQLEPLQLQPQPFQLEPLQLQPLHLHQDQVPV